MDCLNADCGSALPVSSRYCVACGRDAGAPNVRQASELDEITALDGRYADALATAKAVGNEESFHSFETVVATESHAVMCMPMARLLPIATDPNQLISTFSLQVEGEARVPHHGISDAVRTSTEEAFFPSYSKLIRFAALSLTGRGQDAYGECSVEFKDGAVEDRSSVFSSPLFEFVRTHGVGLGAQIPKGYRATWKRRGVLAAAKTGGAVDLSNPDDAARALLPTPTDYESDCIEVHIFGPLNIKSIQRVRMAPATRKADRALQQAILEKLRKADVNTEISA